MQAVVFDWDGTLVDTLPAILRANVEVLHEYGVSFDEARYRAAYTPDWRHMYRRLGVPEAAVDAAGRRWLELYQSADTLAPFDGVEPALRRLAAAGRRLGIVTAGHREVVEDQLARFGLADLVPVRVCGDDPLPAKPDPAPLRRALAELEAASGPGGDDGASAGGAASADGAASAGRRANVARAVYVGDAPDDMRMARAVGARAVGIVGILGSAEDLLAAGADEVSPSVAAWVDAWLAATALGAAEP